MLATTRRVIRVQPIHNELGSAGEAGDLSYTWETERESLRLTLDELGLDAPDFAGWSGGSRALIEFALSYPARVRSLTLIEPPIYAAAPGDPEVAELARIGDAFLAGEGDPAEDDEFVRRAGIDPGAAGGREDEIAEALAAARGGRPPSEAAIDLDALAAHEIPTLVVSGDHHDAIERLCDGLAHRLGARREIVPGAGHAVPRAAGFNPILDRFLAEVEAGIESRRDE
jgi:pimeloyl-ACP methyl ester carboxylesterase